MSHAYHAYAPMRQAGYATRQLWRLPLALLTFLALFFASVYGIGQLVTPGVWIADALEAYLDWLEIPRDDVPGRTLSAAAETLAVLSLFILFFISALVTSALWYRRGLGSLVGPWGRCLSQAGRAVLGLALLGLVLQFVPLPQTDDISPGLPLALWQAILPFALVLLLIQVSAEEVLFRGLLQSQLAARFSSPWLWMVLPSVLFALGHSDPSIGSASSALVVGYIFIYALTLADITARSGTLGPAIVMHFFNNMNVLLIVSPVGPLDGLALNRSALDLSDAAALAAYAPVQIGATVAAWAAVRIALWR